MLKKICAFFFVLLLAVQPAFAETDPYDDGEGGFEHFQKGEKTAVEGYFIDVAGMAKLISDKDLLVKKKDIECKLETDKLQIEIDKLTKEFTGKLEIQEKLYNQLLEAKTTQIIILQESNKKAVWQAMTLIGVGVLSSVAIFAVANKVK
jgi:hypothetical protein